MRISLRCVFGKCTRKPLKFVQDELRGENESCCVSSTYKIGMSQGKSCGRWMFHRVQEESIMREVASETVLCQRSVRGTRKRAQCQIKVRDRCVSKLGSRENC